MASAPAQSSLTGRSIPDFSGCHHSWSRVRVLLLAKARTIQQHRGYDCTLKASASTFTTIRQGFEYVMPLRQLHLRASAVGPDWGLGAGYGTMSELSCPEPSGGFGGGRALTNLCTVRRGAHY